MNYALILKVIIPPVLLYVIVLGFGRSTQYFKVCTYIKPTIGIKEFKCHTYFDQFRHYFDYYLRECKFHQ